MAKRLIARRLRRMAQRLDPEPRRIVMVNQEIDQETMDAIRRGLNRSARQDNFAARY